MKRKTLDMQSLFREGQKNLEYANVPDAKTDAWRLLELVTGVDFADYLANPHEEIAGSEAARYRALIEKRADRIPLQHLTGEQEFMGYSFLVSDAVLIPRQDTEILVETARVRIRKGDRILDLCTGSGCILLSLMKLCPGIDGVGADLMEDALFVARANAARLGVEAKFLQSDLFGKLHAEEPFDLIVSNPPYIPTAQIDTLEPEVRLYDPREALDGRADGLYFFRRIATEGASRIKRGGWLLFEIGSGQAAAVSEIMRRAGFGEIFVKKDLAGLDRVVGGKVS